MDLNERVYAADQAQAVLENPAFDRAFNDIKQELTEQWQKSPVRDNDGRERLYQLLQLTNKLQLTLVASLNDGKLARQQLKHEQTLAERAKAALGRAW